MSKTSQDPIIESVRQKLLNRSEAGMRKYGCGLDRTDLSTLDWLTHLQEELLDGACYVQRLIREERGRSWQPMEFAPKDRRILLKGIHRHSEEELIQTAEWVLDGWYETYGGESLHVFEFSGWKEIPV